ncbi:MAG: hypothetical protein UHM56_06030, partial [Phascolarctobacterium sp.]|nr:hypothetical protein [Phascolarctobacterium sp.]
VNAKGKHGEVNNLLKNFLKYVITNEPVDEFTEDVARQIVAVKNDPIARRDFMVLATRIKDAKRQGFIEGEAQGELKERLKNVKAVMEKMEVNAYEAMNILEIPLEEQQKLLTML